MKDLHELVDKLKQERDELRVKLHLASADLKDEWQDAEQKLLQLEARMSRLGDEAKDAAEDVGDALELLGDEIGKAFKRLRRALK